MHDPRSAASLVERETELAVLDEALAAACSGLGSVVLVTGPAGIGKTSLVAAARRRGGDDGMRVLHGRGTELERDFPLGVARQCLEPAIRREGDRARLLQGAARLAGPALLDVPAELETPPVGLLHGLYWLVVNLADEAPVLLLADDAHWADEPSLHFLVYLARRVESLRVALVVAARDDETIGPWPAALAQLRSEPAVRWLEPAPLAVAGIESLLRERGPVDGVFARACREATGGNPFLLGELTRALAAGDVPFTAAGVARIAELTPPTVARAVAATLARLGPDACALARAAAILGEQAPLELAAELAGVTPAAAAPAASALALAGVLEDSAALAFQHPILAGAVRSGLPAHERALAHARAAELLRERGAGPERVALQLLHTAPAGDSRLVAELRQAAERATRRGAPGTAAGLLARALAEPPEPAERADVLLELGRSEFAVGRADEARAHLEEAYYCAPESLARGRILPALARASPGETREFERLANMVEAILPEVAPIDPELGWRLRALRVLGGLPDREAPPGATLGEAIFLGNLVFARMKPGARAADIADIAERAAGQVDGLLEEGAASLAFIGIVLGLRWSDRLEAAERLLDLAIASARRRGATSDFASALTLRATVRRRAGRLRDAEADARVALGAILDPSWAFARGIAPLVGSLLDRGLTDEAQDELAAAGAEGELLDTPPMTPLLLTRMAVRAARRQHALALADWEEAERRAHRGANGPTAAWIEDLSVLVDVHQGLGDRGAAEAAAERAGALARDWDTPAALGQALHARARLLAPERQAELFTEAVALLERSPVRLEHARALVSLGAALRRRGHRVDSREPLREGYELARRCGAEGLAEQARAELRSSGVRLRREALAGADALTPSERRIAELAASDLSNAEIAQELFLTVKTIEMHLTNAYRKLDIGRRKELVGALAAKKH